MAHEMCVMYTAVVVLNHLNAEDLCSHEPHVPHAHVLMCPPFASIFPRVPRVLWPHAGALAALDVPHVLRCEQP